MNTLSNNFWIATVLLLPLSDQASLRSDTEKNNLVSPMHPLKFIIFHSTEGQTFYWSIMTAIDSIKCWCTNSGMTGQVGGFQNPEVCLQAFPSFLSPHSLPALLLAPSSTRSLTFIPRSFHLNRTETLAMQAIALIVIIDWWEHCSVFLSSRLSFMLSSSISKWEPNTCRSWIFFQYKVNIQGRVKCRLRLFSSAFYADW